jgi:hypothetical protein
MQAGGITDIRATLRELRGRGDGDDDDGFGGDAGDAGFTDGEIEHLLELTAGELAAIDAGDLSGWAAKNTPELRARVESDGPWRFR